jgi:hypothetical protein
VSLVLSVQTRYRIVSLYNHITNLPFTKIYTIQKLVVVVVVVVVVIVVVVVVLVVVSAVLVKTCGHNTEAQLSLSSLISATKLQTANNSIQSLHA